MARLLIRSLAIRLTRLTISASIKTTYKIVCVKDQFRGFEFDHEKLSGWRAHHDCLTLIVRVKPLFSCVQAAGKVNKTVSLVGFGSMTGACSQNKYTAAHLVPLVEHM